MLWLNLRSTCYAPPTCYSSPPSALDPLARSNAYAFIASSSSNFTSSTLAFLTSCSPLTSAPASDLRFELPSLAVFMSFARAPGPHPGRGLSWYRTVFSGLSKFFASGLGVRSTVWLGELA